MRRVVFVGVSVMALLTLAPAAAESRTEVDVHSSVANEHPLARNGRIAFVATETVTPKGLASIRPDGTKPVLVHADPSDPPRTVVPSPDGTEIAYEVGAPATIYVARADGKGRRRVAEGSQPSWSPDGMQLVLVGRDGMLRVAAIAGGRSHDLGVGGSHPAWSPTADWIAFVGDDRVEAIRPDGTDGRTIAATAYPAPLLWSPSGRWLAFTRRDPPYSSAYLDVIRLDGSGRRTLGDGWSWDQPPAWAPGTDLLAFRSGVQLRIQSPDGGRLTTADIDGPVAWSPDGRFVAVGSTDGLALAVVDATTGSLRRLGRGRVPQWSPDGIRLAFVRAGGLWTVPAAGGTPRRIAGGVESDARPVWLRSGRIVYARSSLSRRVIASVTATGRNRRVLRAAQPRFNERNEFAELAWSPDGKRLAYVADIERSNRLEVVPANGGRPRLIATRAGGATWSPDGKLIAFSRGGIHVLRLAGGKARRLTRGEDGRAAWSPDGRHIGFVRAGGGPSNCGCADLGALTVIPAGGGPLRRLVPAGVQSFSWSPDGRRVTYDDDRGPARVIGVIGVGGKGARRIAFGDANEETGEAVYGPRWSPDGTRIAYSSEQYLCGPKCSEYSLVVISPTGRPLKLLDYLFDVSWSPNGRRLLGLSMQAYDSIARSVDPATGRGRVVARSVTSASWQPLPSAMR